MRFYQIGMRISRKERLMEKEGWVEMGFKGWIGFFKSFKKQTVENL